MVKVPLSNSFLERRDARRKFSESLGAGASLATHTRQRISLGSENDRKFRLRSCQSWKASSLSLGVVVPTKIKKYRMKYVELGKDNLRSHFVLRPRRAPEWLRARFLTFTTSFNTTNPNTYVKFIFLRTSPLKEWFLLRFPPNFQERFLMSSASPDFVFWAPKIKQFCFEQV